MIGGMWGLALRNARRNALRTALASGGIAVATGGLVVALALSLGGRQAMAEVAALAGGVIVHRSATRGSFLVAHIPVSLEDDLARVEGASAVVPERWELLPPVGAGSMPNALLGLDPRDRERLRQGGVFTRALVDGGPVGHGDLDGILISRSLSRELGVSLGSPLRVLEHEFRVAGIFDTGSWLLDRVLVAHASRVRALLDLPEDRVSCFFLEAAPGVPVETLAARASAALPPGYEATPLAELGAGTERLVARLDPYLAVGSAAALVSAAAGVVMTMLLAVRERAREIGALRATGWSRREVFRLFLAEGLLLGALGTGVGLVGGVLVALAISRVAALEPRFSPVHLGASACGSILLASLAAVVPASRAARLDPIAALRSH